jgi:hypothetical protein
MVCGPPLGPPTEDTPQTCAHMKTGANRSDSPAPVAASARTDLARTKPAMTRGEDLSMTGNTEDGSTHSVENLADQRSSEEEFHDVMDLLRASPRTRHLSDADLNKRARTAWTKFEHAPVRSFVPVLVEREVLRGIAHAPAEDTAP